MCYTTVFGTCDIARPGAVDLPDIINLFRTFRIPEPAMSYPATSIYRNHYRYPELVKPEVVYLKYLNNCIRSVNVTKPGPGPGLESLQTFIYTDVAWIGTIVKLRVIWLSASVWSSYLRPVLQTLERYISRLLLVLPAMSQAKCSIGNIPTLDGMKYLTPFKTNLICIYSPLLTIFFLSYQSVERSMLHTPLVSVFRV